MQQTRILRILRIYQFAAIVFVLLFLLLLYAFPAPSGQASMTPLKWGLVLLALYCAVDGFIFQRRVLRGPAKARVRAKSTPESRWMLGSVMRIVFAEAIGLYGLLLHFMGGPDGLAALLIAINLILLLAWKPGSPPIPEPQGTN